MKGYEVNIVSSTRELSPKEKIKLKDLSNSINLDNATQAEGKVVIDYDYKDGTKYNTGSESFLTTLEDIQEFIAAAKILPPREKTEN